jgi:hypothetical protein
MERIIMRLLIGIILGGILTVGGAYLYDSRHAAADVASSATTQRPMVNWDVVGAEWHRLTERARSQLDRFTANVDAEHAVRPIEPRGG